MSLYRACVSVLLCVAALGAGCAGESADVTSSAARGDMSQCTEIYSYAPAAYVIHVVSGDAVILDPSANDFQIFCDVESAKAGLEKAQMVGRIPPGDWKVYRVYGEWSDMAVESAPGVYLLNKPAPLVDWVN